MRALYIAQYRDASLLRALEEMGWSVESVTPPEALWAITEGEGLTTVIYDDVEDVLHFSACAKARPNDCMMLAIVSAAATALRVPLLRAGADFCMNRPLSFRELQALVQAFSRRQSRGVGADHRNPTVPADRQAAIDPLIMDRRACRATYRTTRIALSLREFSLLILLAERVGAPLDRDLIWRDVWNADSELRSDVIDLAISRLRRKLVHAPVEIVAVRTVGYCLRGAVRIN